jgi:hypothetical protein
MYKNVGNISFSMTCDGHKYDKSSWATIRINDESITIKEISELLDLEYVVKCIKSVMTGDYNG